MPKMVDVFLNMEMNAYRAIPDARMRKAVLKKDLLDGYERSLDGAKLDRYLEQLASPILLGGVSPFMRFYQEAESLYREGYFYSCVCVCGITGERIESEVVHRAKAQLEKGEYARRKKQFEANGGRGTANLLAHSGLITSGAAEAIVRLWKKRIEYIHPKGPLRPEDDAKACIRDLAFVINELADAFKFYEIHEGMLVRKGGVEGTRTT